MDKNELKDPQTVKKEKDQTEGLYDLLNTVFGRVVISLCYAAANEIKFTIKEKMPTLSMDSVLFCTGIFTFTVAFIKVVKPGKIAETILSVILADSLSATLAVVKEPSSYVIIPSIILYITIVAFVMTLFQCINTYTKKVLQTMFSSIDDFLVLYAASRSLKYFQRLDETVLLGIISICYICIPAFNLKNILIINAQRVLDSLTARGFVLYTSQYIVGSLGVSGRLYGVVTEYVLLHVWNHIRTNSKLKLCGDIIVLSCAQKLISYIALYASSETSIFIFTTMYMSLWYNDVCPHLSCKLCRLGASFSLSDVMQQRLEIVQVHEERILWYCLLIGIVQNISRTAEYLEKKNKTNQFTSNVEKGNNTKAIIITQQDKEPKQEQSIENTKTILGLPQIIQ